MSYPKTRQTVFILIFEKSLSTNLQYDIDGNNYAIRGTRVAEKITADNVLASWTRKMQGRLRESLSHRATPVAS